MRFGPLPPKPQVPATPDERAALTQMFESYVRLRELGWNDIMYCPKDGRVFDSISFASVGIHDCRYVGEWPKGRWEILDGDIWPTSIPPAMFREKVK